MHACINPRRGFFQQKCVFVHEEVGGMCQNFDVREPCNAENKDDEHLLIEPETVNLNEIICKMHQTQKCVQTCFKSCLT